MTSISKSITQDKPLYYRCKGHPDVRHVDCGGQLAIGGSGWVQVPVGLGFRELRPGGPQRFVVDAMRYPAYSGFCMKCKADGDFIRTDRKGKLVTKRPKIGGRA